MTGSAPKLMERYFRGVGLLAATELVLKLRVLVLIPIITQAFGAVSYGLWSQVSVLVSLLAPVLALGTDSAMLRFLSGKPIAEIQRGFFTVIVYYVAAITMAALVVVPASGAISSAFLDGPQHANYVVLAAAATFAALVTSACRSYFRAADEPGWIAGMNIVQAVYATVIAAAAALATATIYEVVLYNVFADLALVVALVVRIALRGSGFSIKPGLLYGFVRYGLPLVPSAYAMWVLNLSDRLFISYYGTLADLGVYSVVYGLGYVFIGLIFSPIWMMFPSTAAALYNEGRNHELERLFYHSTRLALGLLVPAMAGMTVLGSEVLRVFATEEFVRGAPLIPLVTLGYTFLMLSAYFEVALGLAHRQIWSSIATGAAAGTNLVLNALLVPSFGIAGAAWATAISFGIQLAVSAWKGAQTVKLSYPWGNLARICAASLGMAIVVNFIPATGVVGLLSVSLLGAVVYALLLALLGEIASRDLHRLARATGLRGIARAADALQSVFRARK